MDFKKYIEFNDEFLKSLALCRYKYAKSNYYIEQFNSAYYFLIIARDYGQNNKMFIRNTEKFYNKVSKKLRIEYSGKEILHDRRISVRDNKFFFKTHPFGYENIDISHSRYPYLRAERVGKKYLLSIWGKEYSRADNLKELNQETEAFVLVHNYHFNEFDSLKRFPNLKVLIINSCGIDKVPEEIFSLTNLEVLSIRSNEIEELPSQLFNLVNLKELDISGNKLTEIPMDISRLSKLKVFISLDNMLGEKRIWNKDKRVTERIPGAIGIPKSFGELKNLKIISINYGLNFIPPEIFKISNLEELDLSDNIDIVSVPDEIGNLKKIKFLNLSYSKIEHIPEAIEALKELKHFDISRNRISSLPNGLLKLPKLEYLNLASNSFESIPDGIKYIENLDKYILSINELQKTKNEPAKLETKINLKSNIFNKEEYDLNLTLDARIKKSRRTLELSLYEKDQSKLTEKLEKFSYLSKLNISGHSLEEITDYICKLNNLNELKIHGKGEGFIPEEFKSLNKIERLSLNNLGLKELPNFIMRFKSLKEISLHSNSFTVFPEVLFEMRGLVRIELTNNKISSVGNKIANLTNLTLLNLKRNEISKLPKTFYKLGKLQKLDLSHNKLTEIPEWIIKMRALLELDLSGNPVAHISEDLLQSNCLSNLTLSYEGFNEDELNENYKIFKKLYYGGLGCRLITKHGQDLINPEEDFL